MYKRAILTAVFAVCQLPPVVFSQSLTIADRLEFRLQNRLLERADAAGDQTAAARGLGGYFLRDYFYEHGVRLDSDAHLLVHSERFIGLRQYELSRLGCTLQGAEMGATVGFFLGALGHLTGTLDERSVWILTGGLTAAGAIWGGTAGAEDPNFRFRYRWEPERR